MLTPHFECSQDAEFVTVRIRIPHLHAGTGGEFYVLGHEFKFFLKPYFLRLTFRQELTEDGRERAEHDISTGVFTVWLPKATPGQHFDGLDMITELLRRPRPVPRGPLIEVVGSQEADGGGGGEEEDEGGEDDEGDEDLLDVEVEQEDPTLRMPGGGGTSYGFQSAYTGVFVGLQDEKLLMLDDPEAAMAPKDRSTARTSAEDAAFDPDHYMADYMEDERATEAMAFQPWWRSTEAETWRDAAVTSSSTAMALEGQPPPPPSSSGSASSSGPATPSTAPACFPMHSELQDALQQLPRKEMLLSEHEQRVALCGLVDILFAYAYDVRTTLGEPTVESGWTLRTLSSLLSYLDAFGSVLEASVACVRRSLAFPLVRHLGLSRAVLADVHALLSLGRRAVLRAILEARATVQRGGEYGYLLNRIWLDDYCVWVQQLSPRWLEKLAQKLAAVEIRADMVGWPLTAYESLAREQMLDETLDAGSDDSSSGDSSDDSSDGGDDRRQGSARPHSSQQDSMVVETDGVLL